MTISVFLTNEQVDYWNFTPEHVKELINTLPESRVTLCGTEAEFLDSLPGAQIALVWYFKAAWLEQAARLEWIVTPAAGRDYFTLPENSKVVVDYCSFHGEIMGETVAAMMLMETRGLRYACQLQQTAQPWPRAELCPVMGNLRGSRVTILGFGHIGCWIARLIKPFGVKITGVKKTPAAKPTFLDEEDSIINQTQLDAILPATDHLVICLPSAADTNDIIDKKRLALLPHNAVIYNVGRGNALDETALLQALQAKRIKAAYLDVFKTEPLAADSPLFRCPGVFILPHASAMAPNYLELFLKEFIRKYLNKFRKEIE